MYVCHQCGEKLLDDARFCSSCGTQIETQASAAEDELPDTILEQPIEEETPTQKASLFSRILPILIPLISLVLVTSGITVYYSHESNVNEKVLSLKETAEKEALAGKYDKAIQLLEKAVEQRPSFSILTDEIEVINRAKDYQESFLRISEKIKKTKFDEALKEIASLKENLKNERGPLFESFPQLIEDSEVKLTVGTIKQELNELNTIDELGGKLSILSTLPEKEASAVKAEILNKIVQISTDQVENNLTNKQFSDAFNTIDKGLSFAVNNEKLLALKDRVEQDKVAFEKAEQQRIEKAMEAAAQEDLKNRTAAVEVSNFLVKVDEYGDLLLSGDIQNVATTSISSITVYYTIYDENYEYITDGYTSVYPYYLDPGEYGAFEDIYYGIYQNVNVEIDNITWYLN